MDVRKKEAFFSAEYRFPSSLQRSGMTLLAVDGDYQ